MRDQEEIQCIVQASGIEALRSIAPARARGQIRTTILHKYQVERSFFGKCDLAFGCKPKRDPRFRDRPLYNSGQLQRGRFFKESLGQMSHLRKEDIQKEKKKKKKKRGKEIKRRW